MGENSVMAAASRVKATETVKVEVEPVAEEVEQLVQALFFARWCNKDAMLTALGSAQALADPDAVEAAVDAMAPWCNHTAYPVGAVQFEGKEWARRRLRPGHGGGLRQDAALRRPADAGGCE